MAGKFWYWVLEVMMAVTAWVSFYGGYPRMAAFFLCALLLMCLPEGFRRGCRRKYNRVVTYVLWFRRVH